MMNSKQQAYISTPYFASTKLELYRNYYRAACYKALVTSKLGVQSVSPLYQLARSLDLTDLYNRGTALKVRYQLLRTCSQIVLCGELVTTEMCDDLKAAVALEIPIYFYVDGALYFVPDPDPCSDHLTGIEVSQSIEQLEKPSYIRQLSCYWRVSNPVGDNFICVEG